MGKTMERRKFLKAGALVGAGAAGAYGLPLLTSLRASAGNALAPAAKCRWGMVIDLTKCPPNCTACVDACKRENNVGSTGDRLRDIYRIRKVTIESTLVAGAAPKAVPLLCNHCDEPPCALVCPIKATYKREDGIVIVDPHRCMGCRYCVIACPYNARHFNFRENEQRPNPAFPRRQHGVAESCDLCAHLLDQGKQPACVAACEDVQAKALCVGNLNDPASEIAALIRNHSVKRLREDLGTEPKVFYIGL
jgi:molybdopterin-containing oxidoreductase family iron-sulfur binding subunit